jgi:hypothetical protein
MRCQVRVGTRGEKQMKESEGEATEGEVLQVAEAGICGMIEPLKEKAEDFSPDVMINAAMHILSAWVASSQTTSSPGERDADLNDLLYAASYCPPTHEE